MFSMNSTRICFTSSMGGLNDVSSRPFRRLSSLPHHGRFFLSRARLTSAVQPLLQIARTMAQFLRILSVMEAVVKAISFQYHPASCPQGLPKLDNARRHNSHSSFVNHEEKSNALSRAKSQHYGSSKAACMVDRP